MNRLTTFLATIVIAACGGGGGGGSSSGPAATPPPPPAGGGSGSPVSPCDASGAGVNWEALLEADCSELSAYRLFDNPQDPTGQPKDPGFRFELSTPLFSDYASKYRFLYLPPGTTLNYDAIEAFDMPVGTAMAKTFALPFDSGLSGPGFETVIETRLLIHRESGWTTLVYLWQQDRAELALAGANVPWSMNQDGTIVDFEYRVPSRGECKVCHQFNTGDQSRITPIGPKARLLNRNVIVDGVERNQLEWWSDAGWLAGLPPIDDVPQAPDYTDTSADLTARAKGYLDVNCAHCHRAEGFASISGLRLGYFVDHTSFQYGICKQPPGYDGGEAGLSYDIVPGNADESILPYRMSRLEAKDRMPPIGRAMVHAEGVALVREWVDSLSPTLGECARQD